MSTPAAAHWPLTLTEGDVCLRPLARSDSAVWTRLRLQNAAWLQPWEATRPPGAGDEPPAFAGFVRAVTKEARAGRALPMAMTYRGEFVGQLTVSSISYGSLCAGAIGYWISEHVAGRGITPTAVAMISDHCFFTLGLHRIEIAIRPENAASLRVVAKLGFREEGLRPRYLHIAGQWADHRIFALNADEVGPGLLPRWRERMTSV